MVGTTEQRNRARIAWRFWVAAEGVDSFPRLRRGNISATGAYFETDAPIGLPGTVQWLYLSATESSPPVEVMARVVRVVPPSAEGGRGGVAVEFMPEHEQQRDALLELVREVGAQQLQEEQVQRGTAPAPSPPAAAPRVQRVMLETTLPARVGDRVRLTVQVGDTGARVPVEGIVAQVLPMSGGQADAPRASRVEVRVPSPAEQGLRRSPTAEYLQARAAMESEQAVDLTFADLVADLPGEELLEGDLAGSLERIKLTSLLAFLERSRLTGVLHLESGPRTAQIHIREGRLIDVVSQPPESSPRGALARVIRWREGAFEFVSGDSDHPDRLGINTRELLSGLETGAGARR